MKPTSQPKGRFSSFILRLGLLLYLLPFSTVLASDHAGPAAHQLSVPWVSIAWHALNFSLLAIVIFLLVRRPAQDAIRNRALHVRHSIEEANRARDEARLQYEELAAKLADFQSQVDKMRSDVLAEAQQERAHILAQAAKEAKDVLENAERAIHEEGLRARRALQTEAVNLAVALAEDMLKKQASHQDHVRLSREVLLAIRQDGTPKAESYHGD